MYQAHSSAQPPVDLISVELNAGMAPAPGTTVDLAGMASADLSQGVPVLVAMATACTQQGCSKVLLADAGTISFQEFTDGFRGEAIGKTGTTDQEYDLWFVGGTPNYASALWVGYDTPARVGGSASEVAAPLWGWWMDAIHEHVDPRPFEGPELEFRRICNITGKIAQNGCLGIRAPFLPGTRPESMSKVCAKPDPDKKYVSIWKRRREAKRAVRPSTSGETGLPSNTKRATGKVRSTGPAPF